MTVNYVHKILHRRYLTGFWICQSSEYTRIRNMSWLHMVLNRYKYAWISPEYVWLSLARLNVYYLVKRLHETRSHGLEEHMRLFSWRHNMIFSILAGSICFVFSFKLNTFINKISNFFVTFVGWGGRGSRISIYLSENLFFLSQNF